MTDAANGTSLGVKQSTWRWVGLEEIPDLVALLVDPLRKLPVVGLSTRPGEDRPPVNPRSLGDLLEGRAHVVALRTGPVTRTLAEALPVRELVVYEGCARVWWPGIGPNTDPFQHPLLKPNGSSGDLARRIVEKVWDGRPASEENKEDMRELLCEMEEAKRDTERFRQELSNTRQQLQRLQKRTRHAAGDAPGADGEADALSSPAAFLAALYGTIAQIYEAHDMGELTLKAVKVGEKFLESVRALQGIPAGKVLEVAAHVVTGRAESMPGLGLHPLRTGPGGTSPRVRATDDAKAWRCALQVGAASARRLHYWSVPGVAGGLIEFASVGVHDDLAIPE
jgi:hypothetical protein